VQFSSNKDKNVGLGFDVSAYIDECPPHPTTLNSLYGTVTDGSSIHSTYKAGQKCEWVISPYKQVSKDGYIHISVNYIDLREGDELIVYDGDSVFAPVLQKFTDKGEENNFTFKGTHKNIYIQFNGANPSSTPNKGFSISWDVCTGKCLDCGVGSYYSPINNECNQCPNLTVALDRGLLTCSRCPPGSHWISTSSCKECAKGFYGNGTKSCHTCSLPKVSAKVGSVNCSYCPDNSVPVNTSYCLPCKTGYYAQGGFDQCKKIINNDDGALILYVFIGITILIVGVVIFMIFQKRRKSENSFEMY